MAQLIHNADSPRWSWDHKQLAFARDNNIWTVNADGTGERPLTTQWNPEPDHDGYTSYGIEGLTWDPLANTVLFSHDETVMLKRAASAIEPRNDYRGGTSIDADSLFAVSAQAEVHRAPVALLDVTEQGTHFGFSHQEQPARNVEMRRRWFKFLALVLCFALLAVSAHVFFGGECLLLQHAVKLRLQDINDKPANSIAQEDSDKVHDSFSWDRQWTPNDEVAELHLNDYHHPTLYSIARHDLHTGATTIKTIPFGEQLEERYVNPALSPNGQWLLWHPIEQGETAHAWNAVTGRQLRWKVEEGDYRHFENHWLADSRHWLEYVTIHQHFVTLHGIQNPNANIRMTLPPLQSGHQSMYDEYDNCVLTTHDHLITCNSEDINAASNQTSSVTFQEFALQPEQGKVVRLKSYRVTLPIGLRYIRHAVSPDGSHILWQVEGIPESPLQHWIQSKLPHPPPRKQTWVGLWTSRLNGSDWHEVGHIVLPVDDSGDLEDGVAEILLESGWLPDCKTAWFKYKSAYYSAAIN